MKDAHPGKRVEVWQQDEARIGQQGTLTRVWGERGSRPSAVRQSEYEWAYLFAAVNPLTGASSALIAPTVNTQYMNRHLAFIGREAGPGVHVVLVLDQAGWHVAKALKVPKNMTLLHLPPYSPELTGPSGSGASCAATTSATASTRTTTNCSRRSRPRGTASNRRDSKR